MYCVQVDIAELLYLKPYSEQAEQVEAKCLALMHAVSGIELEPTTPHANTQPIDHTCVLLTQKAGIKYKSTCSKNKLHIPGVFWLVSLRQSTDQDKVWQLLVCPVASDQSPALDPTSDDLSRHVWSPVLSRLAPSHGIYQL